MKKSTYYLLPAITCLSMPLQALACASCGCTLSTDWDSLGYSNTTGFKVDLRYDYLSQDQLRSGNHSITAASASQISNAGNPQEVESFTHNHYVTLGIDYSSNTAWGISILIPYIQRDHATLGTNSDGTSPADGAYQSNTSGIGDIKVIGRYQGFSAQHNLGVLFGFKLPTGSTQQTGTSTDPNNLNVPTLIDRSLQLGTGTTDAIIGAYYLAAINTQWDYFAQVTYQSALDTNNGFRPGDGINLNFGARYLAAMTSITPQVQLNLRHVEADTGINADTISTGGNLAYISPGISLPLGKQTSLYSFVQLPIYQDVNGVQLTPSYTASIGLKAAF